MSRLNGQEGKRVRWMLACTLAGVVLIAGVARFKAVQKQNAVVPFRFPTRELAALDRDLQARFAVVPDKDFGIERTYGNQHYLYDPQTPGEQATITALKQNKTDAAFYLMSRALWLRSWDGAGYKPIQGPVHLTGRITLPLPRAINFMPKDNKVKEEIIDQENAFGASSGDASIPTHNPNGTPVPAPTPPSGAPPVNTLQALGNRVFEMAEDAPHDAQIGVSQNINKRWKVIAVPIRASNKACLPCHTYRPMGRNPNATTRTSVEVGDALGVAFYLYSSGEQQAQKMKFRGGARE